jgi:hypothetical protein
MMPDKMIPLNSFTYPMDAYLLRAKLEMNGIACELRNEHIVAMNWFYANSVGGIVVEVAASDFKQAYDLVFDADGKYVLNTDDLSLEEEE